MKRIILLLLCILLLTGCTPKVAGWVSERHHDPSHMEQYTRYDTYQCGTNVSYSGTTPSYRPRYCTRPVQDTRFVPDKWRLIVVDDAAKSHTIPVSREDYDRFTVNTRFDNTDKK